ncbi:hypothetical protein EGW08_021898 [Elysia chlorotica]|uniref:Uncharacterized protein n=1 Tax=Elysia chlorotica TaxID=188477 RepID=A0A433SMC3_ELYCH|nr:hypothetical protein EGW08_021898 [Elysia chlorotica]
MFKGEISESEKGEKGTEPPKVDEATVTEGGAQMTVEGQKVALEKRDAKDTEGGTEENKSAVGAAEEEPSQSTTAGAATAAADSQPSDPPTTADTDQGEATTAGEDNAVQAQQVADKNSEPAAASGNE